MKIEHDGQSIGCVSSLEEGDAINQILVTSFDGEDYARVFLPAPKAREFFRTGLALCDKIDKGNPKPISEADMANRGIGSPDHPKAKPRTVASLYERREERTFKVGDRFKRGEFEYVLVSREKRSREKRDCSAYYGLYCINEAALWSPMLSLSEYPLSAKSIQAIVGQSYAAVPTWLLPDWTIVPEDQHGK